MGNMNDDSPSCPICGGDVSPKFSVPCDYRKPDCPHQYDVVWCQDCDYGLVAERPSKEEVAGFYELDNYYTHGTQANGTNDNASLLDRLRTHLAWRLDAGQELQPGEIAVTHSASLCEIGCGNGSNLSAFKQAGYSVFGVEPDPAARAVAQAVTKDIFEGTAEELPAAITRRKFDVVLMSHVLEHCLDVQAAVRNAKSILKDGGTFIVETPNNRARGFETYGGAWPWSDIPRHLNFFTEGSLNRLLEIHGFKVQSVKYCGFCRQFFNAWLRSEEEIWSAFSRYNGQKARPNFKARAWKLLLRSVFVSRAEKYDSVRLIGIKA
jgi:SAM-dependent methyltransferase